MRAGLAISLLSPNPPQLIILDEPTNHLDLESIAAIEEALSSYWGAILVASHDEAGAPPVSSMAVTDKLITN